MSHTNYQFPPSSPLHDVDEYPSKDPFAIKKSVKGTNERLSRDEYPTPNPSSSLFRSSSPARENDIVNNDTFKNTISINNDFNVLNPDKAVVRVPLLSTHTHFSIGRSSKSCEFAINSKDSFISRTHLKVSFDVEQIILNCVGANGLTIIIPRNCFIYQTTNSKDNFIITENKSNVLLKNQTSSRSIKLDVNHTEFYMRQHETITLPRFENILIQISKQLILLNPNDIDEELTDEEELQLVENESTPMNNNKVEKQIIPKTPMKPKPSDNIEERKIEETPIKEVTTNEKVKMESVKPTVTLPSQKQPTFKIHQDKSKILDRSSSISPKPMALADQTNVKKRASSVEPNTKFATTTYQPLKKKKFVKDSTPELDNSTLDNISNLEEINNILINHLAFSRLSSTPASFLNTISVLTSELSLSQMRSILHNIKCIGIIYRQGKDAAGKPLEEEYYYKPESDDDQGRQNLVSNFKGHGGLRSCRKTHKQYYWKKPAPIKK